MSNIIKHYLQKNLELRRGRNPRYSLRSYARDLALSPSFLSELLNGHRGISPEKAEVLAHRLELARSQRKLFVDYARAHYARSQRERSKGRSELTKRKTALPIQDLSVDRFALVADWYHLALLEACEVLQGEACVERLAALLLLDVHVCREALLRLQRLGLVERQGEVFFSRDAYTSVDGEVPSSAVRSFHRGILQKAIVSLDAHPMQHREVRSLVCAFDSKQLEKVRNTLSEMAESFLAEHSAVGRADSVYAFSIQFFPVSKINIGES